MNKFRKPHGSGGNRGFGDRGGRPSFGGPRPSFGGSRESSGEKYDAVCATCGNKCQVPFRPNGKKPVYCSNCFGAQRREEPGGGQSHDGFPKRDFAPRPSFEPRESRPFEGPRESHAPHEPRNDDRAIADLKQQVGILAGKIDSILRILQASPRIAAQTPTSAAVESSPVVPPKIIVPMISAKAAAEVFKKSVPAKSTKKPVIKKKGKK